MSLGGALNLNGNVLSSHHTYRKLSGRSVQQERPSEPWWLLVTTGNLQEACSIIIKAMQIDPNSGARAHGSASCSKKGRQRDEAIKLYRRALELDARSVIAYNLLGPCTQRVGKAAGRPWNNTARLSRSTLSMRIRITIWHGLWPTRGNATEAIKEYRKAIEINPQLTAAYCNLGLALEYLGNLSEAMKTVFQGPRK